MLEDDFTYVIRKSLRGLELSPMEAAMGAGLTNSDVMELLKGNWDESSARALAPVLELDSEALASHPQYEPTPWKHPAIHRLNLPFGDEQVNAWLVDCGDGKLLIDTGCDPGSLRQAVEEICNVGDIRHLIITHNHRDHVGGLSLFDGTDIRLLGPGGDHTWHELRPNEELDCGDLHILARDLSGHAVPAVGLAISGLDEPVFAVGDALFAGSMGGCQGRESFELAKMTLHKALDAMDERTLLLTGHGPPSRLADEWQRNPFLAAMRCRVSAQQHA